MSKPGMRTMAALMAIAASSGALPALGKEPEEEVLTPEEVEADRKKSEAKIAKAEAKRQRRLAKRGYLT